MDAVGDPVVDEEPEDAVAVEDALVGELVGALVGDSVA